MKNLIVTLFTILTCAFASSCQSEKVTPAEYVYQIRGVVVSASTDSQAKKILKLRHEAIPKFFDAQGNSEPMHAMTMPFPVDDSIEIGTLKKGDEVEATYEVRWKSHPREIISKITLLPPGTVFKNPGGSDPLHL